MKKALPLIKNTTIGEMFSELKESKEARERVINDLKVAAKQKGKFLLTVFLYSTSAGFFMYCVCLGIRLGLSLW